MRAFFFLVFFDMDDEASGLAVCFLVVPLRHGTNGQETQELGLY